MNLLDFCQVNIHQRKVASETTTLGCVCSGMPSRAQTCLELPSVSLGGLGGIARLQIRSNKFEQKSEQCAESEKFILLLKDFFNSGFDMQYLL